MYHYSPVRHHVGPSKHPGSCLQLAKQGALNLKTIRHFIIDECDKVLENIGDICKASRCFYCPVTPAYPGRMCLACSCSADIPCNVVRACADMRADVQDIFKQTPHDKQVMMFSATLSQEIRPICKKFMTDVCPFSARACQPGAPSAWLPSPHPSCGLQASRNRQPAVLQHSRRYTALQSTTMCSPLVCSHGAAWACCLVASAV